MGKAESSVHGASALQALLSALKQGGEEAGGQETLLPQERS